jgi:T-complex protein 1 subunit zeta
LLKEILRSSLDTKLPAELSSTACSILADMYQSLMDLPRFDLHMIEVMKMNYGNLEESHFFRGLVLDHGGRHPLMPKALSNAKILILNVSLEYEKTEVNSSFVYSSIEDRKALVESEKRFIEARVKIITQFKEKFIPDQPLVLINQKGIDLRSLELLAGHGILALRRAKRRNMERLQNCCGGVAVNSLENLSLAQLGSSESIREISVGDEKFTFIKASLQHSGTIVVLGNIKQEVEMFLETLKKGMDLIFILKRIPFYLNGGTELKKELLKSLHNDVNDEHSVGCSIVRDAISYLNHLLCRAGSANLVELYAVWKTILQGSLMVFSGVLKVDDIISAGRSLKASP